MQTGTPAQGYITNFALAHTLDINDIEYDKLVFSSKAVQFWYDKMKDTAAPTALNGYPVFRIYQTARDMQGLRNPYRDFWTGENFLHESHVLHHHYVTTLGFYELNEILLTSGKLDFTDGWHFTGVSKLMEGMIFINIICNNK